MKILALKLCSRHQFDIEHKLANIFIMTKDEIFQIIKKNTLEVLPKVAPEMITIDQQLKNLGANSIDRMEIVTLTMEDLNIQIPAVELGKTYNLQSLVDLLYNKKNI
ncbi:acyl carrier protein [Thioploca ingrica]|uniref:Acyl carrier protein n=1 Tax=Thioploca ingrica TaxID=40754 RepID=A0A090BVA0_9GAMM|nr:acyl carrier protein [Thioploca ingrica]